VEPKGLRAPFVSDSLRADHDRDRGVRLIAGVDEVGRGPWAGPIMAAGVLFDLERLASGAGKELFEELNDSKGLADTKCERLAHGVLKHAEAVSLASVPARQIDRIGIDAANATCLEWALRGLGERAELRLVDGDLALGAGAPMHELIAGGDATSATVAAASIVAKVARNRLMTRMAERYPGYSFESNRGYTTDEHKLAFAALGATPEHRLSFNANGGKPRRASWRELPDEEKAAHLLATPQIADDAWTDKPRLPRETRTAFIRRILVGET
jgi:ribonuclease HII